MGSSESGDVEKKKQTSTQLDSGLPAARFPVTGSVSAFSGATYPAASAGSTATGLSSAGSTAARSSYVGSTAAGLSSAGLTTPRSSYAGSLATGSALSGSTSTSQVRSQVQASVSNSGEDRSRLLDQWSQNDKNRYTLPLKANMENSRNKGSESGTAYAYTPKVARPGTLRVELRVRNQNPFIGSRNIKTLHAGRPQDHRWKSSDFLVFLLPVPKRIADLHYDGQNMTIVPVRPSIFPGLPGPIQVQAWEMKYVL
jgi:hypothetical protein